MHIPFRGPGGDRSFNAAMFLGVGLWFWANGIRSGERVTSIGGALITLIGVGLWIQYSWFRWPGAVFLGCLAAFNLYWMARKGFSWLSLLANFGVLWVGWSVLKDQWNAKEKAEPEKQEEERPMASIVLLLREPRHLDSTILANQLSRAWGQEFIARVEGAAPSPVNDLRDARVVSGETPLFVALAREGIFVIHNQDGPYLPQVEDGAATIPDARAREAVLRHRAWLAVDLQTPLAPAGPIESYTPTIGRAIAELADEDCLAVFHPASMRISAWDPALEDVLRGPDPLQAFTVPVDPRLAR